MQEYIVNFLNVINNESSRVLLIKYISLNTLKDIAKKQLLMRNKIKIVLC